MTKADATRVVLAFVFYFTIPIESIGKFNIMLI